ncbi:MAG TPA: hypothetical protein VL404_08370 [Candidatus Eisenbacteria bacterium]|nr:hypothetical protein [Candidatus Eisenbacteria bacterium]
MEDAKYVELELQLKKITEQLGFLEKKIDQLLAARVEPRPFSKPFSKPYGQKPYGQKPFGQKPFGGPNKYGGPRQGGQGQGFNRNYSNNQGRTRTAFYEGGAGAKHEGSPSQGHFKKKFAPHRPHRPS